MKRLAIAVAVLVVSSCAHAPRTDLAIWRSPDATVSQRCDAASALLSPGMTISEVEAILGTPDAQMRERGLIIPDGGWVKRWGFQAPRNFALVEGLIRYSTMNSCCIRLWTRPPRVCSTATATYRPRKR